ncbi:putative aminotransferase-like, plant mobile domain-containing protein [Medicago truncatula]|uniref:Putative aminotransferase-like, plant mobile domain-containing protein n=1 Tax=Medicago truncatula TaxID=3880 RepID=A0A396IP38_MEDTR|nr:putative aminotransferase-like, plant mobile domain-containing protein [Medicago truncatula]
MGLAFLYEQLSLTSSSYVGVVGGYMNLLEGWVLAHFRHLVPRRKYEDYDRGDPYVGRWKPPRGFADDAHFICLMESMEHCLVIWRSYEHRRDLTPFQDVCWYSGWIMADKDRMVCHFPKRVLRQYGYVQTVLIPPTTIVPLEATQVVTAFLEFDLHVLS